MKSYPCFAQLRFPKRLLGLVSSGLGVWFRVFGDGVQGLGFKGLGFRV